MPLRARAFFGDVLALARESWVREMSGRLVPHGYGDYRRSDALALRVLDHGSLPLGTFAKALGVSRQAARKVATGLVERDFAHVNVDADDARRRNIELTPAGHEYAKAIVEVIRTLDGELSAKVDPSQLAAAREVLTFVKDNFGL